MLAKMASCTSVIILRRRGGTEPEARALLAQARTRPRPQGQPPPKRRGARLRASHLISCVPRGAVCVRAGGKSPGPEVGSASASPNRALPAWQLGRNRLSSLAVSLAPRLASQGAERWAGLRRGGPRGGRGGRPADARPGLAGRSWLQLAAAGAAGASAEPWPPTRSSAVG